MFILINFKYLKNLREYKKIHFYLYYTSFIMLFPWIKEVTFFNTVIKNYGLLKLIIY